MARFIRKNRNMLADLKAKRWAAFARAYNGAGYKQNAYDTKMAAAYQKWAGSSRRPVTVIDAQRRPVASEEPDPITDEHTVSLVQTWLRNIGYTEVGTANGKIGPYTETAILAFREENGLPPGKQIDAPLLVALATAKPRQIDPERAQASAATVQRVAPEARQTWCAKIWSGLTAIGAGAIALGQGVISNLQSAKDYLQPVQDVLSDVPPWVWAAGAAVIAAYIWHASRRAEAEIKQAVYTGGRR